MATIAVQAASALHVLGESDGSGPGAGAALTAIRDTSKSALADMRVTLGELRAEGSELESADTRTAGLTRLDALSEAVRAAGVPVTVTIEGEPSALPPAVDHSAYRILQECLTNVLRHAGPDASAQIVLRYDPGALTIEVVDDGTGAPGGDDGADTGDEAVALPGGHGLTGMTERAVALGGQLSAGPQAGGGFAVIARLPLPAPTAGTTPASAATSSAAPRTTTPGSPAPGVPVPASPVPDVGAPGSPLRMEAG